MMSSSVAIKTMVSTYINNEAKIDDLSTDLKELRKIRKSVVKDLVAAMREAGEEEIEMKGRTFSLTHGLGVSAGGKKKK